MVEGQKENLGKIQKVSVGFGGYQDVCIGISFTLGGSGWGVCDFWGNWSQKRTDLTKWTEEERLMSLGGTFMRISNLLEVAKVQKVEDLKDVPVRVFFNGNALSHWEILTEVL